MTEVHFPDILLLVNGFKETVFKFDELETDVQQTCFPLTKSDRNTTK